MENAWFGYCPCGCVASDNGNDMLCLEDEEI